MKRTLTAVILIVLLSLLPLTVSAVPSDNSLSGDAKSAILCEIGSGEVLYEYNADEALRPASVTKIMSILLIMEAVKAGNIGMEDIVSVSENAASMGGSQVFLEPGEQMSVKELLKCVIIASANDATVALAEFVSGSEDAFVARMNERAAELGMKNTHFVNTNGLDDAPDSESHLTSARDIALMSCELMKNHPEITEFTTTWMDTIRGGQFGLTNTNRLVRFYRGVTGLKTGSTSKAGFCISATAERDGMGLVAVIMGAPTRDSRNEAAKSLLDFGFANYCVYKNEGGDAGTVSVKGGTKDSVTAKFSEFSTVLPKSERKNVDVRFELPESISAPLAAGEVIGQVIYSVGERTVFEGDIVSGENIPKIGFFGLLYEIFMGVLLK